MIKIGNIFSDIAEKVIAHVIFSVIVSSGSALLLNHLKLFELIAEYIPLVLTVLMIVISIVIILAAIILWRRNGRYGNIQRAIPPILFFCGFLLLLAGIFIAREQCQVDKGITVTIDSKKLWDTDKIILPIRKTYRELFLVIRIPEANNPSQFPEFELEKLSPLKGNWEILVEELIPHKLIITGLPTVKADEYYYPLREGEFRVLENGTTGISLDENEQLRINFRNTTEFEGIIVFEFYGAKPKGAKK